MRSEASGPTHRFAAIPGDVDLVILLPSRRRSARPHQQCPERHVRFLHPSRAGSARQATTRRPPSSSKSNAQRGLRASASSARTGLACTILPGRSPFALDLPQAPGNAFLSQSGNNAIEVAIRGAARGLKFGKVANYGNGVTSHPRPPAPPRRRPRNGRHRRVRRGCARWEGLLQGLWAAAAQKPVIIHKAGRPAGARSAALAHGCPRGVSRTWSSALRQAGAIEARSQEQLIDLMLGASPRPWPGDRGWQTRRRRRRWRSQRPVRRRLRRERSRRSAPTRRGPHAVVREKAPQLADWVGNPVDQLDPRRLGAFLERPAPAHARKWEP